MSTVTFGVLWINPASDLTAGMSFSVNTIEHAPATTVTTQGYAGGNFRAVRQKGVQKVATVALNFVTDDQAAQLKTWLGELLCYRDPTGEKFYGVYGSQNFNLTPRPMGDSWAVPLTVMEVTHSEAV